MPRARRPRLDLPGQGPQRQRPVGGAQGTAEHRRRGRAGRCRRRAAVPRRRSSTRTSSGSTTSSSTPAGATARAPATSSWNTWAASRSSRSALEARQRGAARYRSPTRSPTRSRSCPRSATCTTEGLVYCDFKPDNVIQTEEQLKLIDMGGVRQIDGDEPHLRNGRLPGPGDRDGRSLAKLGPVHGRPGAGRAHLRVRRVPGRVQVPAARFGAAAGRAGIVRPVAAPRHARPAGSPFPVGGRDGRADHRSAA